MQNQNSVESVIILGGGPAGLAAALYAGRAELNPLVLGGMQPGGQASLTNSIENYPGFPDGVSGVTLADLFQRQAERYGARVEFDLATRIDLSSRPFQISTYNNEYTTQSLIIAIGASPVLLKVPGEKELTGKGVSYCATCDGWFFKGRPVVVVGGGDSALEEALFLTRFASKVTIIHRRDAFRAGSLLQTRVRANPKVELLMDTVVREIIGSDKVTGVMVENVKTKDTSLFNTDGVFIFIGHSPNTQFFSGQIELDELGYIAVDKHMRTSVDGVFACGEIADPIYKQVIISAGMGAAAAIQAGKFLDSLK